MTARRRTRSSTSATSTRSPGPRAPGCSAAARSTSNGPQPCQSTDVPELVLPTAQLHAEFLACRDDWGPGLHEDGFGIGADDDLDSPDGFRAWVHDRVRLSHRPGTPCPPEQHGSLRWIV